MLIASKVLRSFVLVFVFNNSIAMETENTDPENYELRDQCIQESIADVLKARGLQVVAELGVADQLKSDSKSATEIASSVGANPDALYRVMRLLTSYGYFEEDEQQQFTLTRLGMLLRQDVEGSIHNYIVGTGEKEWWNAIRDLDYSVRTGESSFCKSHGKSFWDFLEEDKEASNRFNVAMKNYSDKEDDIISTLYNFGQFKTIVDVGGGQGGLIKAVLKRHSEVEEAILFDMPNVIKGVTPMSRLKTEQGDFFTSVPFGADAYIVKRVLLDWDDEKALNILQTITQSMPQGGKLFVIDSMIPSGNEKNRIKDLDILMLALFAGRHRTQKDFETLFEKAGLELVQFIKTPVGSFVIEGTKQ